MNVYQMYFVNCSFIKLILIHLSALGRQLVRGGCSDGPIFRVLVAMVHSSSTPSGSWLFRNQINNKWMNKQIRMHFLYTFVIQKRFGSKEITDKSSSQRYKTKPLLRATYILTPEKLWAKCPSSSRLWLLQLQQFPLSYFHSAKAPPSTTQTLPNEDKLVQACAVYRL